MATIDLKIGEQVTAILNALTPRVTIALTVASFILLGGHRTGCWHLSEGVIQGSIIAAVGFGSLAVISGLSAGGRYVRGWSAFRAEKHRIERELPFLSETERMILGHLLERQIRMIPVLKDGERASSLMAKGFLVVPSAHPKDIHRDINVQVPDHVWTILERHRAQFPFVDVGADPWRTNWMNR